MAMTKPSSPTDVADIQRRMAQIRHEMHQEVQGAVQGARTLTDWRSLVKSYPWLSLSVAAAVGYFVVPKRRKETPTVVAVAAPGPEFLATAGSGKQGRTARSTQAGPLAGNSIQLAGAHRCSRRSKLCDHIL